MHPMAAVRCENAQQGRTKSECPGRGRGGRDITTPLPLSNTPSGLRPQEEASRSRGAGGAGRGWCQQVVPPVVRACGCRVAAWRVWWRRWHAVAGGPASAGEPPPPAATATATSRRVAADQLARPAQPVLSSSASI
jgi:hypothetical protein